MKQAFNRVNKLASMIFGFRGDRRGTVAVIAALASLPILAGTGMAIDVYRAVNTASALQNSVDAAALAAASFYGASDAEKKKIANDYFNSNGYSFGRDAKLKTEIEGDLVTVKAETDIQASFVQLIGVNQILVARSATAKAIMRPVCILSLSPSANNAIHFQGHPSLRADDCVMHANSQSSSAILGKGNPFIKPMLSSAVGGLSGRGFASATRPGAGTVEDPFEGMRREGAGFCIQQPYLQKGHHNLSPGVYCSLKIGPHADVDFAPGLYVVKGNLDVQPNANLHGDGVTFDLAGMESHFWLSANSSYDLSPPTTGPYRGVIIRQRGSGGKFGSKIYGGGDIKLNGAIYAPHAQVLFQGGIGVTFKTPATAIVADTFLFRGNASIIVDIDEAANGSGSYASVLAGARLVK